MKKQIFTLLTLLLCVCSGAWGQTYTNEDATLTWAFTSHTSLGSTNVPNDAFLSTNFSAGSNLNMSSVTRNGKDNAWGQNYNMVAFIPKSTVAKNAGESAANTLTFTITPATGITFTPTNVSLTGCNYGGTGDPKTNIYVLYSDDTTESLASSISLNRDDKSDVTSPSNLSYNLENAVAGKVIVKIWMDGLTNTSKGVAFTNIVVTGKVSGTPVATTTYTITAASNDASLGSATGTATVAENEEVTLTATPTAAGYFTKWQKDGVDFAGNTVNPITVTATADATYTAIFEAKKKITFAKGEGTGTAPSIAYVIGGDDYTIPEVFFLFKTGATLTGWNDGTNSYAPGETITNISNDITLTAIFTDNAVALGDEGATVNWTFARNSGAPTITCENSETDYVQHTTIGGTRLDAVMHINTIKNEVLDGFTGKVNNTSNGTCAQVNKGTKFTIPVVKGAVITYTATNGTPAAGNITFGGENGTVDGLVTTYTYAGITGTLDIIAAENNFYPSGISVFYPAATISISPSKTYTTYVTTQALDFTGLDLKAYVATAASSSEITMVPVTTVPAGTPLVLKKGSAASYDVPVAASATAPATNLLKASDGVSTIGGDGVWDYILSDGKFYHASAGVLPAGKCYLHLDAEPSAHELTMLFGDDPTAISDALRLNDKGKMTTDSYFNLAGQRVAQPTRGLYIVNGRKVVIK